MDQFNPTGGHFTGPIAQEDNTAQAAFIRKTYGHVALAVGLFVIFEAIFIRMPGLVEFTLSMATGWSWLLLLGLFGGANWLSEKWASDTTNKPKQYAGLLLTAAAHAFLFLPMIFIGMYYAKDPAIINKAATLTLFLFGGLTAVVFITKKDFSFLRNILAIGFFIAIGLIVAGIAFGFNLGLWFSVAMVALAAGSILYQTSNVLHKYHKSQYVAAAIGLFASLMLLFWYILSILMSSD